jgi:tRNA(Ile)-lysidine synthase
LPFSLFSRFKKNVYKTCNLSPDAKILLAVSGGIDSMVLMYLFSELGMQCEVAHCNFQLRGEESDQDEVFVRDHAQKCNFPVFVARFETEEYAAEHKLSIQMAARQLRYDWFNRLTKAHNCRAIAIAHNLNDTIETFFINMGRGTGIDGFRSIQPVSGIIVRPLLSFTRTEIVQYASVNQIPHREDSSNNSDKYQRNFIRHNISPLFSQIFPGFDRIMERNLGYLSDTAKLYHAQIDSLLKEIVSEQDSVTYINIPKLKEALAPQTVLYELLNKYGFSSAEMDDIWSAVYSTSGKQFYSATHQLIKDRECFILLPRKEQSVERTYVEEGIVSIEAPLKLTIEVIERTPDWKLEPDYAVAWLDASSLNFPLMIRKWQKGDYFIPLGMSGMKKISDYFIDSKMSITDKENAWLLVSDNQIVWVIGRRVDNRFRIKNSTQKIIKITLVN